MIPLFAMVAVAQDTADFRDHVDQAKFYLKKGWHADALGELERAVALEDGRLDAEAWFLLAQTRYALGDLPGARFAADRAFVHSSDPNQEEQSRDLTEYLAQAFGILALIPPRESVTTTISLELRSRVLDPELKRWVQRVAEQLSQTTALPIEVGLPAGTYAVNGALVEVGGGERTEVVPAIAGRPLAWQTLRIEMSLGVSAWFGRAAESMLPAVTSGLALGVPVGPLEVAVVGDWTPRGIALADGSVAVDPVGVAAGVRLGTEFRGDEALRIRPALSWRYGQIPGVQIPCGQDDSEGWTCRGPTTRPQLFVVPRSRVHRVGVELAATWLPRDRKSGLGGGIRLLGEVALGTLPEQAEARDLSSKARIPYSVHDRSWTAIGVRALLDMTYAF